MLLFLSSIIFKFKQKQSLLTYSIILKQLNNEEFQQLHTKTDQDLFKFNW